MSDAATSILWSEKRPRAVWRGSTTGDAYTVKNWRQLPRSKAVLLSRKRPDLLDAGFTNLHAQADDTAVRAMEQANMSAGRLDYRQLFQYRALLSIDGNSVADRLPALLAGGAVMKQDSERIEFWYHDLVPFVHYIPVKHDMSNLEELLDFALQNTTLLMEIARNGRDMVLRRLHRHCILCYWIQLLHMYSKFMRGPIKAPAKSLPADACRL
jgi:protein glucosyltransferase